MHRPYSQLQQVLLQTGDWAFLHRGNHTKAPEVGAESVLNTNPVSM